MNNNNPLTVRLTKKVFSATPPGSYLTSNVMASRDKSIFQEIVSNSPVEREDQWKRIVSVGAAQRLSRVFNTPADFREWLSTIVMSAAS